LFGIAGAQLIIDLNVAAMLVVMQM